MIPGYVEFEFDLPEALLEKLVLKFDDVEAAPLDDDGVAGIPEEQGVYQLFLSTGKTSKLVYIGKTDADAGLQQRLRRHAKKIQHRAGLSPGDVTFKAVRLYVFTAMDLETQLIKHYGGTKVVAWNHSGFGSNDPGKERDTTKYKANHFDALFPIDISRKIEFELPDRDSAGNLLRKLKRELPYLIRFETIGQTQNPHTDLSGTEVTLDPRQPRTPESVLKQVVMQLPSGWHATMLPSHVIIYKDDPRTFPSGRTLATS